MMIPFSLQQFVALGGVIFQQKKGGFQHFWDQNPDQKISQGYFQHLACVSRLNMLKQPTYHQPLAQYFIFL